MLWIAEAGEVPFVEVVLGAEAADGEFPRVATQKKARAGCFYGAAVGTGLLLQKYVLVNCDSCVSLCSHRVLNAYVGRGETYAFPRIG